MRKCKFLPYLLLLFLIVSFPNKIFADRPFDTYFGNISWAEEKARLYNLAIELKHDPEEIGYITFRPGTKENKNKINFRIARMKKYLFSKFGFSRNRIVFIISDNPNQFKETFIILQPVSKNRPPPNF